MSQPIIKNPTEEEIQKIDETLDKLDALLKTLPIDYQMDYAQEVIDRYTDEDGHQTQS